MSTIYNPEISVDLTMWNPNVKDFDDCRVAFQKIYETLRTLSARLNIEIDVGHPHTWTGASYSPSLSCAQWENYTTNSARNPTLGTNSAVTGYSWSLFGWTHVLARIKWGDAALPRDLGYGKWRCSLPNTPYNAGVRWIGRGLLKQQFTIEGGYNSDDVWPLVAAIKPGESTVEFYFNHSGGASTYVPVPTYGLGGADHTGTDANRYLSMNTSFQLGENPLLEFNISYRTEA